MMYKGVIFEQASNHIIVHCDDGRYLKLKSKADCKVGDYIAFFDQDIIVKKSYKHMIVLVAAALIIALVLEPILLPSHDVYAIISIDHASSVEYGIDENGLVREVNHLAGEGIKDTSNYIGMSIEDVVLATIARSLDESILISETIINDLGSYSLDQEQLTSYAENNKVSLYIIRTSKGILDQAKNENVSAGKMYLANEIAKQTNASVDDLLETSVDDLLDTIEKSLQPLDDLQKINGHVGGILDEVQNGLNLLSDAMPFIKEDLDDAVDAIEDAKAQVSEATNQIPTSSDIVSMIKQEISESLNDDFYEHLLEFSELYEEEMEDLYDLYDQEKENLDKLKWSDILEDQIEKLDSYLLLIDNQLKAYEEQDNKSSNHDQIQVKVQEVEERIALDQDKLLNMIKALKE